ncbi:extracellular matrix glycoprotein pherophorin-V39 [Volvox carteri f. nagariensis]|uniref:Extracellular matrix glycoprotein pherophorin-V39 n=1 Tax=Volvox carteri f. nagariensis TaxID=3068 RepID=D8UL06_VOLCA|nr:extracellular matrix glycoprotein pherophorin-V39 [Volvox carteri f. nagariensis]EFJ39590.1 extracellular matrix glycoprotein pherophorin-V39 [Volvox carteri f. nagariensis]|eukprot:XP_002959340.1 extracellular matrix glycoprotein pherophorin-V39 [Volvox carteri f. nagariensis]
MGLPPMVVNFTVDPTRCQPTKVSVCGSFVSQEEARKLEPWAALQSPFWLDSLVGQCNAVNSGLSFLLRSETDNCLKVITEKTDCKDTVNVTFPPCKCDNRKYATPFYVVPTPATQEPGRDPWTNLYCFKTKVAPKESVIAGPCNSSSTLHKAEIWADMSLRRQVRGFRLTPSGGTPRWASTSWGPSGANQLKATNINWSSSAAQGGEICIELKNTTTLSQLCLGDRPNTACVVLKTHAPCVARTTNINWSSSAAQGGEICIELKNTTTLSQLCLGDRPNNACVISLFNKNRKCCPTYTAAVS